ncbi:hypothetical protein DV515_00003770, partial [Chloebia gouldiae]
MFEILQGQLMQNNHSEVDYKTMVSNYSVEPNLDRCCMTSVHTTTVVKNVALQLDDSGPYRTAYSVSFPRLGDKKADHSREYQVMVQKSIDGQGHCSPGEVSISDVQPSTSRSSWSSENAADYKKNREKKGTSKNLQYYPSVIYLKTEQETFHYLSPDLNQFFFGEQAQSETYPYELIALLANDYYNYCQVILQMVREMKLDKVEDCIMSFWTSLQPERIELMCLPDVCQLLKSYDRYLFKELENILLPDFLDEVPAQHIDSIRSFSENVKCWMLNPLGGFPLPLQTSKSNEAKEFVKRLRRQTDLCNMVKTVRALLNNNSTVTVLRSGLHAIFSEKSLDVTKDLFQEKFRNPKKRQKNIQLK